jgi:hypothetical protein
MLIFVALKKPKKFSPNAIDKNYTSQNCIRQHWLEKACGPELLDKRGGDEHLGLRREASKRVLVYNILLYVFWLYQIIWRQKDQQNVMIVSCIFRI